MNHLPVLPVLIPLIAGALLLVLHRSPLWLKRSVSLMALLALGASVLALGVSVDHQFLMVYQVGNWPSFAGIVVLADRLSIVMLGLLVILSLASALFASGGDDAKGAHFHVLFQFQLMGLCGAFLTHDLFNLFVFFEVLLAASYGLLLHGQGGERLKQGMHYVVLNLVASALFLFAVGVLYGVLGTLNMSDLSARMLVLPPEQLPLAHAGAWLLLVVFGLKAALLPLYFWLPRTYASATAPTAILFAIMTKLGVYAVVRVYSLMFGEAAGDSSQLVQPVLLWAGAGTTLLAALGALAAPRLRSLLGYVVVGSAGVLFMSLGMGTSSALAAGLFYLVHSTLAAAAFFLVADWVRRDRGGSDSFARVEPLARRAMLGGLFLILAMAVAGLPPLGGFLGKVLLLAYQAPDGYGLVLWSVVLVASLLNIIALARAGGRLFWQQPSSTAKRSATTAATAPALGERVALLVLMTTLLAVSLLASDLTRYVGGSAAQLQRSDLYREAVLGLEPIPTTVPR